VRSITQRWRPSFWPDSTPVCAMRIMMWRRCRKRRQRGMSYALSACSVAGCVRRCPLGRRIGGMPSTRVSNTALSCRFAPVRCHVSGVPRRSVTWWRFVPGVPRRVGSAPVADPLVSPGCWHCPDRPAPSRSGWPRPARRAAPGAGDPRRRALPVAQPAPADHAAATADLGRKHLPRDAGFQDNDDAGETGTIGDAGTSPCGLGGSGGSSGAMRFQRSLATSGVRIIGRVAAHAMPGY
jgi:hypothetical protein